MRNIFCQSTCLFYKLTHSWCRSDALDLRCVITRFDILPS